MEAPDNMLYEYAVVRYVPRVDREEFVNIGLIMMCKRRKWLKGRIALDATRLKAFDPNVDLEQLSEQSSLFESKDVPFADLATEEKYRWLSAVKSAVLQVSPSHPGIAPQAMACGSEDADAVMGAEFERLFKDLVSV